MGGSASTSTQANTTNISNDSRSYNIGLTGADATRALDTLNSTVQSTLTNALQASNAISRQAIDFQTASVNTAAGSLNNVIQAARDVSSRAIAAGTGQATPIAPTEVNLTPILLVGAAGLAIAIFASR